MPSFDNNSSCVPDTPSIQVIAKFVLMLTNSSISSAVVLDKDCILFDIMPEQCAHCVVQGDYIYFRME